MEGGSVLTTSDYWRAIILYGRNTATYKLALARALMGFVANDQTQATMPELARSFFDIYLERLQDPKPQLLDPGRQTVMERIVELHRAGSLNYSQAIDLVQEQAFRDVIPRFHLVGQQNIEVPFYQASPEGLLLTDAAFEVLAPGSENNLEAEVNARWDLLEGAFLQKRQHLPLANDIRRFYLLNGYERTPLTSMVPVLWGYQDGCCFYCGEALDGHKVDVDHVIPRQVLQHDKVWNLVLAHRICNADKTDHLPQPFYLTKLVERNERLIASNHPIKHQIIEGLGDTRPAREKAVGWHYQNAQQVIPHTWQGIRGYRLDEDPFFRRFVRSLVK